MAILETIIRNNRDGKPIVWPSTKEKKMTEYYVVCGKNKDGECGFVNYDKTTRDAYFSSLPEPMSFIKAVNSIKDAYGVYVDMVNAQVMKITYEPVDLRHILREREELDDFVNNLTDTQKQYLKSKFK